MRVLTHVEPRFLIVIQVNMLRNKYYYVAIPNIFSFYGLKADVAGFSYGLANVQHLLHVVILHVKAISHTLLILNLPLLLY